MTTDNTLPADFHLHTDPAAEKAIIGALLLSVTNGDSDCPRKVFDQLSPQDFAEPDYQSIVGAIHRHWKAGEPFDGLLVRDDVKDDVADAAAVIYECTEAICTTGTILGYIRIVAEASQQRQLVCAATDAIIAAGNGSTAKAAASLRATLDKIEGAGRRGPQRKAETNEPFPVSALPEVVADYVSAAAGAIGCDESFLALPLLGCLARAIGNRRVIQLKRGWTEPAIIWAAFVGKSGSHKSPALSAATQPLHIRESARLCQLSVDMVSYQRELSLFEKDMQTWRRSKTTEPPPTPPEEPGCERLIVGDTTIEAVASVLAKQFDGVLMVRDELAGWLDGIGEYKKGGKGSDLAHWLASWSAAPMVVDRKSSSQRLLHIPRAAVSITGGIQPGVLRRAIGREHLIDGLCARLLLAMPEQKAVSWTDAVVSDSVENSINDLFDRLFSINHEVDESEQMKPYSMPLTSEARELWISFYNEHRAEMVGLDDDLAACWSKLEAYAARFALIFQMVAWATEDASDWEVDQSSIEAGIVLAKWFGLEARRVYGVMSESEQERDQRELSELIVRNGGAVSVRQLMRSSQRFNTAEDAEAALDALGRQGWGRWTVTPSGPKGGAPARAFQLTTCVDTDTTSQTSGINGVVVTENGDFEAFEAERLRCNGKREVPF